MGIHQFVGNRRFNDPHTVRFHPAGIFGQCRLALAGSGCFRRRNRIERNEQHSPNRCANSGDTALFIDLSADNLVEGGSNIVATIRRNGNTNAAVSVTLSNDFPARLVMTNQITVPRRCEQRGFRHRASGEWNYRWRCDCPFVGDCVGLFEATELLTLNDESSSVPDADHFDQPGARRVDHSGHCDAQPRDNTGTDGVRQRVNPLSLSPPQSVIIPANQASHAFAALATDNTFFDGTRTNVLRAGASGFEVRHMRGTGYRR